MDHGKAGRREEIVRKLRALLSMTVERGASEAEELKSVDPPAAP